MNQEMEWTLETYRLDELEGKFDFPCVVCVNEGYYSETDAEGFSQGDIMSIDSKLVMHKVAANFAEHVEDTKLREKDYIELEREILVPLNYKGKLKVLRNIKNYESVRELATDFPRYAKVRENFKVTTEEKITVTIQAGTVIELDRILPGSMHGPSREPDKLVIQFQHLSGPLVVAVPLNERGKFRTVPDDNEYTIKEAIDRYSLPQHVSFIDDKIKRVYTQDLLEGIENMSAITETLRLNRLITQNVLVGHYKPLDGSETKDTERFRQRTLVVLPIDNPDIREIEVNVLKGVTDDVYEQVFLVRNVSKSNTMDIVDGSLYVDFAMRPGIKIISHDEDTSCDEDKPPPRPPKPGQKAPAVAPKPHPKKKQLKKPIIDHVSDDADDTYIVPEAGTDQRKMSPKAQTKKPALMKASNPHKSPEVRDYPYDYAATTSPRNTGDYSGFSLADMDFASLDIGKNSTLKKKLVSNIKSTFKGFKGSKEKTGTKSVDGSSDKMVTNATQRASLQAHSDDEEEIQGLYEEINESEMMKSPFPITQKSLKDSVEADKGTHMKTIQYHEKPVKPTALVQPSKVTHSENRKLFKDLNNKELIQRLQLCGLPEMANFCEKEKLNGSFFKTVKSETLKRDMNLKGIQLAKFIQMRDANWVPT
ncbi:uncharacterized protein LOC123524664 isoform X2 [Mercenaria mercenaria]|nr:uncharacterized protein LOC123524664 isoform X2 [Mercenaria mercenaria]